MNPINLLGFAGSAQAPPLRLLASNLGFSVTDAEPGNGQLQPLRDRRTVATVPTGTQAHTIYRMQRDVAIEDASWLSWAGRVSVVRSLDPDDTTERIYFTGSGGPKWTNQTIGLTSPPYPQGTRELAVPAPDAAPVVSQTAAGTGDDEVRYYVRTFVNDLGWESAPSPVSDPITVKPGAHLDITLVGSPPAGNYGITRQRIYRTQPLASDSATTFFFLRELASSATSTTDDARALGETIATVGWLPMPSTAHSLLGLWNGMLAYLDGKTVGFTEPDSPYAAPIKYSQQVRDTPLGLAKWESNLLVLTTGRSVMFNGSDPTSMSESGTFAGQSCSSASSIVEFPHGVVWASNEGLAYSGASEVITTGVLKPVQWRALINPSSIVAGRYGRLYVASYTVGGVKKGFMFDPLRPGDGIWFLSSGFDACYYDELLDALFVLEGGNVRRFDAATALLTATFVSKQFHQVGPRNFSLAKVVAEAYPVTLKLYTESIDALGVRTWPVTRLNRVVQNADPFTLPGGFLAEDWQIEVSSAAAVQAVHLGTDMSDFRDL